MSPPARTVLSVLATLALAAPSAGAAQAPPGTADTGEAPEAAAEAEHGGDPDDERARAYFALGRTDYEAGDYEAAIEHFQRAYALSHRIELLFNLYQAYHRAGRLAEAIDHLERFLAGAEVEAERRATLEERLANLRQQLAAQRAAEREEEERRRRAEQERLAQARAEAAADPRFSAGIVMLSIAGAAAVTFGITGGLALREDKDLASRCGADAGRVCTDAEVARLQTLTRTADASLGLALASAAAGVILVVLGSHDEDEAQVLLGPTGLAVRGQF